MLITMLTGRGRMFAAVGIALLAAGVAIGQRDVLRIAILLLATPLLSAALLWFTPARLRLRRRVQPEQVQPDTPATVQVQVRNTSRAWSRLLLAEEQLPFAMTTNPRFTIDRLPPGGDVTVSYRVSGPSRGVYHLGPLIYRVSDALGMATRQRRDESTVPLIVLPRIHPLGGELTGGAQGQADDGVSQVAVAGDYDVSTRGYLPGDDLRRVHWRSSARRGELMVRREEQSHERLATVILDTRRQGHLGAGSESSLEWAVSAAASVCEHLAGEGFAIRLLTDGIDHDWVSPEDSPGRARQLTRLATVTETATDALTAAVELAVGTAHSQFTVAVLGQTEPRVAAPLAQAPAGVAMLLAVERWADLPTGQITERSRGRAALADDLGRVGWACGDYGPSDSVSHLWGRLVAELRSARV